MGWKYPAIKFEVNTRVKFLKNSHDLPVTKHRAWFHHQTEFSYQQLRGKLVPSSKPVLLSNRTIWALSSWFPALWISSYCHFSKDGSFCECNRSLAFYQNINIPSKSAITFFPKFPNVHLENESNTIIIWNLCSEALMKSLSTDKRISVVKSLPQTHSHLFRTPEDFSSSLCTGKCKTTTLRLLPRC